jgi:hypothetical protein
MDNGRTEMSSRFSAFISWIEFLGILLILSSRLFLREYDWLGIVGIVMLASGYLYRMYLDHKAGRKKSFQRRLIFLVIAVIAAFIVGYLAYNKES